MQHPIQSYTWNEESQIRVLGTPEAPLFVAIDICRCLQINNSRQALSYLPEDERRTLPISEARTGITVTTNDGHSPGGARFLSVVTEPGLYRLIFKSRKPEAEAFRRWVLHDVLPSIRATGRYEAGPALPEAAGVDPLLCRLDSLLARGLPPKDAARVLVAELRKPAGPRGLKRAPDAVLDDDMMDGAILVLSARVAATGAEFGRFRQAEVALAAMECGKPDHLPAWDGTRPSQTAWGMFLAGYDGHAVTDPQGRIWRFQRLAFARRSAYLLSCESPEAIPVDSRSCAS